MSGVVLSAHLILPNSQSGGDDEGEDGGDDYLYLQMRKLRYKKVK